MRKNKLIALIGTLTMAAAGLAAVSAGVSSKKADSVSAADSSIYGGSTFYLFPESSFADSSAKGAIYFYGGNNGAQWTDITASSHGYYTFTVPGDSSKTYTTAIAVRYDPSKSGKGDWNTDWGQTKDCILNGNNSMSTGGWSEGKMSCSSFMTTVETYYFCDNSGYYHDNRKINAYNIDHSNINNGNVAVEDYGWRNGMYYYKATALSYFNRIEFNDGSSYTNPLDSYYYKNKCCTLQSAYQWKQESLVDLPTTLKFTLDNQGATSAGSTTTTATIGSTFNSITVPEKTNYEFDGYYSEANGGGTKYIDSNGSSATNCDFEFDDTLYANWVEEAAPTYTVSFNNGGGTGSMTGYTKNVGESFEVPEPTFTAPSKKKFSHWSGSDGNTYNPGDVTGSSLAKDYALTLTAVWKDYDITDGYYIEFFDRAQSAADRRIKLDYNGQTGQASQHTKMNVALTAGESFKVVKFVDEVIPSGEYYGTDHADSKAGAATTEGQLYSGSDNNFVVRVAGNYNFYFNDQYTTEPGQNDNKVWIPANSYTVIYNNNGGSGTVGNQTAYFYDSTTDIGKGFAKDVYGKDTFTAPDATKIFDGWSTNSSASSGEYKPGDLPGHTTADKVPNPTSGNSVTLYAIWRNKTVADGHYIEGIIGGTQKRIEGTLDTTNNQIVFDSIQFSEGDHFKVVTYTNEVPAWSGFSQVDAKDGSARKEGQVVVGDQDDIAIHTGDAGTYTIYYHHEGYTENKVYIPALYTVTWKNYDNSTLTTEKYGYTATPSYKGATPTKPSDASYDYSFSGWNPAIGQVLADTTYTAQFSSTAIDYDITYVTEGTLKSSVQTTYNCDAAVTLPVEADFDTKPADSTFVGWYNDADFEDGPVTSIPLGSTGDKTFYGKWEGKVTVTYIDDSGSREIKGFAGATLVEPTVTARSGYTADWEEHLSVFPNSAKTINASYTANTYEIIFNSQGGSAVDPINATFGQAMPNLIHKINKTGYDFLGFFDQASGGTKYYNADWVDGTHEYYSSAHLLDIVGDDKDTATLYAQWSVHTYTLSFNSNGGSEVSNTYQIPYNTSFNDNYPGQKFPTPTLDGYKFDGWYADSEGTGIKIEETTPYTVGHNLTLVAHWTEIVPKVTVTVNNSAYGSVVDDEGNPVTTFTVPYNTEAIVYGDQILFDDYEITAVPTESTDAITYSFDKWDGIEDGDSITENIEIEAIFTATNNPLITIKSCENGHIEVDGEEVSSFYVPAGSVAEIADDYILITNDNDDLVNIMIVAVADEDGVQYDYAFESWSGISEGEITSDIELSATFSKTPVKYQLSWDFGGGTPTGDYTSGTVAYDSAITYPTNVSKDGYEFTGFDKELSTMPAENTKITAQFTAIDYTITLDKDGGEGGGLSATSYQISDTAQTITITDPVLEGYTPSYTLTSAPDGVTIVGNTITISANTIGNIAVSTTWTITPKKAADLFASKFLEEMGKVCDDDGKTTESQLSSAWSTLFGSTEWTELSDDAKNILKNAKPDAESTDLTEKFGASYDYICSKYKLSNVVGRDLTKSPYAVTSNNRVFSVSNVSTSTWIIASVAIIGIAAVGVFFIYRKRKEN